MVLLARMQFCNESVVVQGQPMQEMVRRSARAYVRTVQHLDAQLAKSYSHQIAVKSQFQIAGRCPSTVLRVALGRALI